MKDQKKCPLCGRLMVLRTAHKGKYAGNQFYGCTGYPQCKHTENINSAEPPSITDEINDSNELNTPFMLSARSLYEKTKVYFYQTIGLTQESLKESRRHFNKHIENHSSWRIDTTQDPSTSDKNESFRDIYKIALKILNRGKLTLNSEYVEKQIKLLVNKYGSSQYKNITFQDAKYEKIWLDGTGFEKQFYYSILPKVFGNNYHLYCIPQTHISSLVSNDDDINPNQRVDFLLLYNNKKLVVELDGQDHIPHASKDNHRDESLKSNGFEVLRFSNKSVMDSSDSIIVTLKEFFDIPTKQPPTSMEFLLNKIVHQLEITIVHILFDSLFDNVTPSKICVLLNIFDDINLQKQLLNIIETDLQLFLSNLFTFYGIENKMNNMHLVNEAGNPVSDIHITFNCHNINIAHYYEIHDFYLPYNLSQQQKSTKAFYPKEVNEELLEYFLKYVYRFDNFREGQYEAIKRSLERKDSIVLLPTGAGKSLAFQLASLLLPGIAIVIEPIISLIDDQIDNLSLVGIDRAIGITSQILDKNIKNEYIEAFGRGEYLFCYIAPERFQIESFRKVITSLTTTVPISLIAIDEAHCISEWGHDFRTSYLNIGRTSRNVCSYYGAPPPLLALTGTASHSVLRDIKRELKIHDFDAIITPDTFDRKELNFLIESVKSDKKRDTIKGLLEGRIPGFFNTPFSSFFSTNSKDNVGGLIFCPHVNGDHGVVNICQWIRNKLGINSNFYSGKAPSNTKSYPWIKQKREVAKQFKHDEINLLVTTKSFGMGIDKPNIGFTIHYGLPNSIESFYQEAGRAGRNRRNAICVVIVSNDHKNPNANLLNPSNNIEEIAEYMEFNRSYSNDDDISRALFFHVKSFRGIHTEQSIIKGVLDEIFRNPDSRKLYSAFNNLTPDYLVNIAKIKKSEIKIERRNLIEKAIHRLLVIGFIEDYTINYGNDEFCLEISENGNEIFLDTYLQYVNNYNKGVVKTENNKLAKYIKLPKREFLEHIANVLIEFIYQTIEKGRRRAFREMLSLAEESYGSNCNALARERILKYLETSYSEEIENIIESGDEGLNNIIALFEGHIESQTGNTIGGIRSPNDAKEIRGQVSRYLESLPDHPGLLFLRGLSESFVQNYEEDVIVDNIITGINQSLIRENVSNEILYNFVSWLLSQIFDKNIDVYSHLVLKILNLENFKDFHKYFKTYNDVSDEMLYEYFVFSFDDIIKSVTV